MAASTHLEMDNIKTQRKKKSDKAKEKYEHTGGFSQKHVRLAEALAERKNWSKKNDKEK
jgi:hypothetical protein